MADAKQLQFGQRLSRIDRHHRKINQGYVASMNHDGLVIARPRKQGSRVPLRGIFLCLLVLIAFKGFLFAEIGERAYADRMAILQGGTFVEQIGAYAMKADPVTLWVAGQIEPLL